MIKAIGDFRQWLVTVQFLTLPFQILLNRISQLLVKIWCYIESFERLYCDYLIAAGII